MDSVKGKNKVLLPGVAAEILHKVTYSCGPAGPRGDTAASVGRPGF